MIGAIRTMLRRAFGPRMTCREATAFLMSYLDNELPPNVRAEFDKHLARCKACRCYLESYKKTVEMGKDACSCGGKTVPLPEDLIGAILQATKNGRGG